MIMTSNWIIKLENEDNMQDNMKKAILIANMVHNLLFKFSFLLVWVDIIRAADRWHAIFISI